MSKPNRADAISHAARPSRAGLADIPLHSSSASEVAAWAMSRALSGVGGQIVTLNPEIFEYARKSPEYRELLSTADVVTADGIGICVATLVQRSWWPVRTTGVQITEELLKLSARTRLPVVVVGAAKDVREAFESRAAQRGAVIVPGSSPMISLDTLDASSIGELPDGAVVLVALGAPKQEYVGSLMLKAGKKCVFIGVGGAIDYFVKFRNPIADAAEKLGMHWFYRLLTQAKSRAGRQFEALPAFLLREIIGPAFRRVGVGAR